MEMEEEWQKELSKNEIHDEQVAELEKEKEVFEVTVLTLEEIIAKMDKKIKKIKDRLKRLELIEKDEIYSSNKN